MNVETVDDVRGILVRLGLAQPISRTFIIGVTVAGIAYLAKYPSEAFREDGSMKPHKALFYPYWSQYLFTDYTSRFTFQNVYSFAVGLIDLYLSAGSALRAIYGQYIAIRYLQQPEKWYRIGQDRAA